jgi:hypothetical protein
VLESFRLIEAGDPGLAQRIIAARIFTIVDGQLTHHRAVRDDLGLLLQLGCALKQHAVLLNRTVP